MIKVENIKTFKAKGPFVVNIMRGHSPLANPYHDGRDGNRAEVIAKYRRWLWKQIQTENWVVINELKRLWQLNRSGNLTLVCCCKPLPCHGDVVKSCIEWMSKDFALS